MPGEVDLVLRRLRWAFADLPFFVAFAAERVLAFARHWAGTGNMRVARTVLPLRREVVKRSVSWLYVPSPVAGRGAPSRRHRAARRPWAGIPCGSAVACRAVWDGARLDCRPAARAQASGPSPVAAAGSFCDRVRRLSPFRGAPSRGPRAVRGEWEKASGTSSGASVLVWAWTSLRRSFVSFVALPLRRHVGPPGRPFVSSGRRRETWRRTL